MKTYEDCKREFTKTIEQVDYSKHTYEVFRDWLEVAAILCHQAPYWSGDFEVDEDFERLEIVFKKVEARYQPDRFKVFAELFGLITIALNDKFGDFLGEVFMGLDFGDEWRGQFFTPYSLSLMMATLTFGEPEKATKPILVSDPASGAAGVLIAVAETAYKRGYDPRSCYQFDAVDVDRNCFNMSYIQLSLCGLQAIVTHGNTLTLEVFEKRKTMQYRLFQQWQNERGREMFALAVGEPETLPEAPVLMSAKPPAPVPIAPPIAPCKPQQLSLF